MQIEWPEEYEEIVQEVSVFVNLSPVGPLSPRCEVLSWNWHYNLVVATAGPLAVAIVLLVEPVEFR